MGGAIAAQKIRTDILAQAQTARIITACVDAGSAY